MPTLRDLEVYIAYAYTGPPEEDPVLKQFDTEGFAEQLSRLVPSLMKITLRFGGLVGFRWEVLTDSDGAKSLRAVVYKCTLEDAPWG